MNVDQSDLAAAASEGIVTPEQARALYDFLDARAPRGRFTGVNVAYYVGALVVIGGMTWLMNRGWEQFGGWGLCSIAVAYAALFVLASRSLPQTPSGLLVTMAVCMTPLAVYGFERAPHLWPASDPGDYRGFVPYIRSSWCFMEVATVLAGLIAVRARRFPFMVAPIAVSLWFMSMDGAALISHSRWSDVYREASIAFGLATVFAAYLLDHRSRVDYAFWLYFFGMLALWGGMTAMESHSEAGKLIYCAINAGFIALGVLLRRRVFVPYGAVGVNLYLYHLADEIFRDSMLFPFAVTMLGIGVIAAGVQYQRRHARIDAWLQSILPAWMQDLLPRSRVQPEL